MKKLIYILFLLPFFAMGQVSNGTEFEQEAFKATNTQTVTSSSFITTTGTDGTQGKILGENITLSVIPPVTNFTPVTSSIKGYFQGVDTRLGQIGNTLNALSSVKENVANKATDFLVVNDIKYPSVKAVKDYVDSDKIYEIKKTGLDYIVRVPFNDDEDILITMNSNTNENGVFNLSYAKAISKTEPITTSLGYLLNGASADDATPVKVNGMYLGANHGNTGLRIVTSTTHGKDLTDVGSRWSDGTHFFTLLKVIDANTLWFISDNGGGSDNYLFYAIVGTTLTYSSNGSHTSNITLSSDTLGQLYPSLFLSHKTIRSDNGFITTDGTYKAASLKMVEEYDIIDAPDMVSKLTSNRPVGGYLTQPDLLNGVSLITLKNTYSFTKGGMIVLTDLITRKQCHLEWYGGAQASYVLPSWATTYKRYIPNTTTVNDGTRNWNFRIPESILTTYGSDFNFTSGLWENGIAPNRIVDLITDGASRKINFNMGYVPIGVSENRNDVVNNSIFLYAATRKTYPNLITGDKVNDISSTVISPNKNFSGVMYRIWKSPELVNNGVSLVQIATNDVTYEIDGSLFVNLDFHKTGVFSYPIPTKYNGRKIKILSKSPSLKLLSDVVQSSISLNIPVLDNGYSYISLELVNDDLALKEDLINKQNSLDTDVTNTKYPTVTAVNTGLSTKQNTLTNPITGSLTTNTVPKATGTNTLGNSLIFDNGTNVGVNNTAPSTSLEVTGVLSVGNVVGSGNLGVQIGGMFTETTMPSQVRGVVTTLNSGATIQAGSIGYQPRTGVGASHNFFTEQIERLRITSTGVVRITNLAGTGTRQVVADASGNLSATNIEAIIGSYTPTIVSNVNCGATPTFSVTKYSRVGNTITCRFSINVSSFTAANTATSVTFNLPIAKTTTGVVNMGSGTCSHSSGDYTPVICQTTGSNTTDIKVIFKVPSTTGGLIMGTFIYDTGE